MRRHHCIMCVAATSIALLLCSATFGIEATRVDLAPNPEIAVFEEPMSEMNSAATYSGIIRIFVTDNDRWDDSDGERTHNAVVGIPIQESITLNDGDSLMWDLEFDYYGLTEEHTTVIAALYNSYGYQGYSVPDNNTYPFTVHEVDATAAAHCGRSGYNIVTASFTHSVLITEGSTTT